MIEFDTNPSTGEVGWENQGTTTTPKPKIVSIEIIDKTDTTIKVKVTTKRNVGGTLIYSIQEENGAYQEIERVKQTATGELAQEEYTFNNLDSSKIYSKIKVEAIAENGETASKEIDVTTIPALTRNNVTFTYTVNGKSIQEGEYTQGPITVKIATKNVDTTGYRLQYTTGNPEVAGNWKDYDNRTGVEFTTKGNLYVRLSDGRQGGRYATAIINNIDTLPPKQFTPEVTTGIDYITVTGSTIDQEATATSASSGIAKYQFSKDGGATWVPTEGTTNTSYTFDNLKSGTNYKIQMKAIDKVGKEIITEPIEPATEEIKIAYQYNPSTWTNDKVAVTITTTPSLPAGYTVEYSKDRITWDSNANTMSQKGELYVRIKNANNYVIKDNITANVVKIDNDKPKDFTITQKRATTSTIEVEATAEDAEATSTSAKSGIAGYRFSKDDGANWTDYQESGTYKFDNLIGNVAGVTYPIKVEAKDQAGNTREAKKDCTTSRNDAYYVEDVGVVCTIGGREYKKMKSGGALCGIGYCVGSRKWANPVLVSTDPEATRFGSANDGFGSWTNYDPLDFHGVTFYVSRMGAGMPAESEIVTRFFDLNDKASAPSMTDEEWKTVMGNSILNKYFYNE